MANITVMDGQCQEAEDQNHDKHPLLPAAVNNGDVIRDQLNNPTKRPDDHQEAAVISASAISSRLWVTPELRERNPEAFASYTPEKERQLMRQAVAKIDESKMQTLKESLATSKNLSRESSFSQNDSPGTMSLSNSDYSHSKSTVLLEGPKATLARVSEMLDERVFTGKQAIIAIISSMCAPIIVFFVVQAAGLAGLIMTAILVWAFYVSVRWYQDLSSRPEPKETPLYLKDYGLMDPLKLKCVVKADEEAVFSDSPGYPDSCV